MRSICITLCASAALLHLAGATSAYAEEAVQTEHRQAKPATAGLLQAGRRGRQLLAWDRERREAAIASLVADIDAGRLDAVKVSLAALRAWADDLRRLEERWRADAMHGDARERAQAAALLHALGPEAVARLAQSVQFAAARPRLAPDVVTQVQSVPDAEDAPLAAPATPAASAAPAPPPAVVPANVQDTRQARIYDVRELVRDGRNPLEIRTLLSQSADASRVAAIGPGRAFLVLAEPAGHARLVAALEAARDASGDKGGAALRPKGPVPPQEDATSAAASPAAIKQPASDPGQAASWRVLAQAIRVPSAEAEIYRTRRAGDNTPVGSRHTRAGSLAEGTAWIEALEALPDARVLERWGKTFSSGRAERLVVGQNLPYNRAVQRQANGAYGIETGNVLDGYAFDVRITQTAQGARLQMQAALQEVKRPMPEVQVRPEKGNPPVTLHRPAWSRKAVTQEAQLGAAGGAALFWLEALGKDAPEEVVVLVFRVAPVTLRGR